MVGIKVLNDDFYGIFHVVVNKTKNSYLCNCNESIDGSPSIHDFIALYFLIASLEMLFATFRC